MTKVLSELHFLPCIGVFQQYAKATEIVLEAQENYQKGSYRNRCHIVAANGVQRLSLPLSKGKNNQLNIQEVELSNHENWTRQHWQSIRSAYGNAPFYFYYADELEATFRLPATHLWEYNLRLLKAMFDLLQWDKPIQLTEEYHPVADATMTDIRGRFKAKSFQTDQSLRWPAYAQVFQERHGFIANLSILDLVFCAGPQANLYLNA